MSSALTKLVSVTVRLAPVIQKAAGLIAVKGAGPVARAGMKAGSDINIIKIVINIIR